MQRTLNEMSRDLGSYLSSVFNLFCDFGTILSLGALVSSTKNMDRDAIVT